LVDPRGPAGEPLFTSSEPHLLVADVHAPTETESTANPVARAVTLVDAEEVGVEEVADVIESVDAPAPSEPIKPKRSIPPPLPHRS
jgi:hypothetical protein